MSEIRERNNRLATSLESTLQQLVNNVTAMHPSRATVLLQTNQTVNQTIISLNNTIGETITVRIDPQHRNNSTVWALAFAGLTNATLKDYGKATEATFDLTNVANMASSMMNMHGSNSSSSKITQMHMVNNNNAMRKNNMTKIANQTSYQSAQFLANRTLMDVFNNHLKPLAISTMAINIQKTGATTPPSIDQLQSSIVDLQKAINNKASPDDVMM